MAEKRRRGFKWQWQMFLRYLSELCRETVSRVFYLLGAGSTAATYVPTLQNSSLLRWVALSCFAIGFIVANFRIYLKYAVERLEFNFMSFHASSRPSNDRRGGHPEFYAKIRATNNSERNCSIIALEVSDEGGHDWSLYSVPSPLPISIAPDDVRDFDFRVYLPHVTTVQARDKIRIGRLLLKIHDHTKKIYPFWLTEEAYFGPWPPGQENPIKLPKA